MFVLWNLVSYTVQYFSIVYFTLLVKHTYLIMMHWLYRVVDLISQHKIPKFHLIFWCRIFVERHSFRRIVDELPENLRKLCLSTKFPHQKNRGNFDILRSVSSRDPRHKKKKHSHLLKKSLMENFFFCAVNVVWGSHRRKSLTHLK